MRDLAVVTSNGSWPLSSAGAAWTPPRDGRDGTLIVNAAFVRLEDLVALAAPGSDAPASPALNTLIGAVPRGVIEDLRLSAPVTDHVELGRARARGRFTRLRLGPEDWPLSVHAASGRFEASGQGMVAEVAAGGLRLSAPDWLARPLRGEKLAGTFAAIPSPEGLRVRFEGTSHTTWAGRIAAQGRMLVPRDESRPELGVTLSLGSSPIAEARALVAAPLVPEPVSRWLDSAAPYGDIRGARLTFHGRVPETPPDLGAGALEVAAELVVPVLGYARDWPEITDVTAVVRLDGRGLEARFESGRILGSSIREATATIEDLGAEVPVARIEGRVEGASANAVRFLAESPLRERFTTVIDHLTVRGDCAIDLELAVPLGGEDRSITVDGRITLDDNRIDVSGFHRELTAVNGAVVFRGAEVASDGITAVWSGEPIRAVIGASPEAPHATRLSIDGRLTRRLLAAYLHDSGLVETALPDDSPLLARVRGDAALNADLDIPHAGDAAPTTLRIVSDLTGLSLDLPPPLGKASATARMHRIDGHITPDGELVTEIRHGGLASAAMRLVRDDGRFRLERGAVRVGPGDADLPDTPGMTVHGTLPVLDTEAWGTLLEDVMAHRAPGADASPLGYVREVSIDAGSATALGARFPDTRVRAARGAGGEWRLDLAGRHLEGVVRIPPDLDAEPMTADLEHFVLEPGSAEAGDEQRPPDPRTLPALSFSARRFVLGDVDLGRVSFTATPSESGMQVERLEMRADSFEGEATGSWSLDGEEHRTELHTNMHGDDLGRMLDSLGFDGGVVTGGETNLSLRGAWTGTPADFAIDRLTGVLHLLSTDGRLTRVERGVAGRVFGLLTVTSLPRRLLLDFSDLFRDGFEYDRIKGSFAIENGDAHTDDLFMEGDTARLEVVGRTGLVSEDYDKLVTIIPKISSSLPLLPLWLVQQILDRNVFDKAFSYQYTVTGPWSEPVVELAQTRRRQSDDP